MLLLRGMILHTPRDPLRHPDALEAWDDGGLLLTGGRVAALGPYGALRRAHPEAPVRDLRGAVILPGLVDTHVHFPQVRVVGALGHSLLDWLERVALPEEARLADATYARSVARAFVRCLLRAGTTTALVFGAHFAPAQAALFEEAEAAGLRLVSGLTLSDRHLRPELHQDPERAYEESRALIRRFHGRGLLRYAVTPRFALSCSPAMLEVCRALVREFPDMAVQTHLNETPDEVAAVRRLFPEHPDYLAVYEAYGLVCPRSVFAHDVHATDGELARLAAAGAAVAHCPSSNAALGSGLFPLARHLARGVRVALGTDVGGGTGFCLLGEALLAYQLQRLAPDGVPLSPAALLYLCTRAGAEALGLGDEVGDLSPGRAADVVVIRPPAGGPLAEVLAHADGPERVLGALFALAREDAVAEVYVAGRRVWPPGTEPGAEEAGGDAAAAAPTRPAEEAWGP